MESCKVGRAGPLSNSRPIRLLPENKPYATQWTSSELRVKRAPSSTDTSPYQRGRRNSGYWAGNVSLSKLQAITLNNNAGAVSMTLTGGEHTPAPRVFQYLIDCTSATRPTPVSMESARIPRSPPTATSLAHRPPARGKFLSDKADLTFMAVLRQAIRPSICGPVRKFSMCSITPYLLRQSTAHLRWNQIPQPGTRMTVSKMCTIMPPSSMQSASPCTSTTR